MANKSTHRERGWSERQAKEYVADAIRDHRSLWDVVPLARRGIVAAKYAAIVTGLDRSDGTIPTAYLENLWADMCAAAESRGMQ